MNFLAFVLRLVCMLYLWCVALLIGVSLVSRACMYCCCCVVFVVVFCYGLSASPVCGCILYVTSLRCSFRFVTCCLFAYVCMVWRVFVACVSISLV